VPVAMPLLFRGTLLAAPTTFDSYGICMQQHVYSCGPAAAVTCLKRLGLPAEEGAIAAASHCGPLGGSDGWGLAAGIERHSPAAKCEYRYVERLEDLHLPAVVDMFVPNIGGHYMAVLEFSGETVVVGDPLTGLQRMPREIFLQQWKHGAIEIRQK